MHKKMVVFVVGLALCNSGLWHGLGAMENGSPLNNSDPVVIKVVNDASVQCSVCYEDLKFSDPKALKNILKLACKYGLHSFHKTCITPWFAISLTCPNCREVVDVDAEVFVKQLSADEYKALKKRIPKRGDELSPLLHPERRGSSNSMVIAGMTAIGIATIVLLVGAVLLIVFLPRLTRQPAIATETMTEKVTKKVTEVVTHFVTKQI